MLLTTWLELQMNVNKCVNNRIRWAIFRKRPQIFLLCMFGELAVHQVAATNYTWDGGAGPANDTWSQANNWGIPAGEGVGWDFLSISGGLNLTATGGNKFVTDFRTLSLGNVSGLLHDFDSSQSYIWTASGITFGAGESESTVFQLQTGGFINSLDGGTLSLATGNGGKDLNLVFTPAAVPEPSPVAVIALGFGILVCWRRLARSRP